ncbi:low affinity sulfate transporter 3-like protein [Carex littledalei]|uniref:Low affinity sulfate transporter 3-like protein n=1 Tax=Carex littledalei TaxID=544730 RepID=A0A833UYJ2_9POAL|nr:low affinity sulfate transporter 3-like protein [Carex littledalei]
MDTMAHDTAVPAFSKNAMVLDSPEPPSAWKEVTGMVKNALIPRNNKPFSPSSFFSSCIKGLFPVLQWGRNYNLKSFRSDLMAGLTLASLGIPQSIGYANLAKLDPQYGLYTSVVPPLIYAVMGSSREIAIGPVAVVSLLLSSMIQKVVDPTVDVDTYHKLVFTVTFLTGIFQASFGLLRLGFLVDLLSHAAIVGFMAGAAIVIGLQQLKGLLGLSHFTNSTDVVSVIKAVYSAVHQPWHAGNFLIGCSFLILILIARFLARRNKKFFWLSAIAPLLSVILSTLIVFLTRSDKHGVKIIQHVHGGLNPSSAKQIQFTQPYIVECAKIALVCGVIALTEAIAVGRSFASVKGYRLDGNKEMMAMGFMNVAGSLSSCYVATGSFSRSAVNFSAGCKTAVSNIVMAATVFLALQLFTRLLYYTPVAILASIILSALPGLIDYKEAMSIWKVDKMDFLICMGTFLGVLFGSVEIGLSIAIIISFAKIVIRAIRPSMEVLGRIEGTEIFCSIRQYPMAIPTPSVFLMRIDCSFLCFMNANFIRERIIRWVTEECDTMKEKTGDKLQSIIIDMSNVMNIDTSGLATLEEIHKELVFLNLQVAIANPSWTVIHKMKIAGLTGTIGGDWIFLTVADAMQTCLSFKRDSV